MNRITITRNNKDELVIQQECLSKQPSGNAQQRQKQIRNGWKPAWRPNGIAQRFDPLTWDDEHMAETRIHFFQLGTMPAPPEIEAALNIARYAENQVVFERAMIEGLKARENQEFCLDSGLVVLSYDMANLELRAVAANAASEVSHTCVDRPHLPCNNPYCPHEPIFPPNVK